MWAALVFVNCQGLRGDYRNHRPPYGFIQIFPNTTWMPTYVIGFRSLTSLIV